MVKREVSILETAANAVAEISYFIEGKGMPSTAKKFVDEAFLFFETLANTQKEYRKCRYKRWSVVGLSLHNIQKICSGIYKHRNRNNYLRFCILKNVS